MSEKRIIGYCEECGHEITQDTEAYVDKDGRQFCSIDCLMEYYEIDKLIV